MSETKEMHPFRDEAGSGKLRCDCVKIAQHFTFELHNFLLQKTESRARNRFLMVLMKTCLKQVLVRLFQEGSAMTIYSGVAVNTILRTM